MPHVSLTRRYRFCAAHRLHTDFLTPQQNWAAFGKCNNPNGHGHNYVVLVTAKSETRQEVYQFEHLDQMVEKTIVSRFDHQDLNQDPAFIHTTTTGENLVKLIWDLLVEKVPEGSLEKVGLIETRDNYFEYAAPAAVDKPEHKRAYAKTPPQRLNHTCGRSSRRYRSSGHYDDDRSGQPTLACAGRVSKPERAPQDAGAGRQGPAVYDPRVSRGHRTTAQWRLVSHRVRRDGHRQRYRFFQYVRAPHAAILRKMSRWVSAEQKGRRPQQDSACRRCLRSTTAGTRAAHDADRRDAQAKVGCPRCRRCHGSPPPVHDDERGGKTEYSRGHQLHAGGVSDAGTNPKRIFETD